MYCIHCRKFNKDGLRTCKHCHKSLLRKSGSVMNMYRKTDKLKKQKTTNNF